MRDKISVPKGLALGTVFVLGLGWLLAAALLGSIPWEGGLLHALQHPILLITETLVIGVGVALTADRYLRLVLDDSDAGKLSQMGITAYSSRYEANEEMLKAAQGAHEVDIAGISLRDILHVNGRHRAVWDVIKRRLAAEEEQSVPPHKRLKVRLLLLDPRSGEGLFRHDWERTRMGGAGLPYEVRQSIDEVQQTQAKLYPNGSLDFLSARLYHHCPFALQFITADVAFVEQYYYRDHTRQILMPLFRYSRGDRHKEYMISFDHVWSKARPAVMGDSEVGTDDAIEKARIVNIYRRDHRSLLGQRECEVLDGVKKDQGVAIQAITGKFFTSYPVRSRLWEAATRGASIRMLLLNPICEQAVLRAVADSHPPAEIAAALQSWTWEKHVQTRLYQDIHQTLRDLQECPSFDIRLFNGSLSFALFLVPEHAFVEQYMYGRSRVYEEGRVLGGEYPAFEFGCESDTHHPSRTPEREMLDASFEVMWSSFSIRLFDLPSGDAEKDSFELSLKSARRWVQKHPNSPTDQGVERTSGSPGESPFTHT
jgi:hypothetical protein